MSPSASAAEEEERYGTSRPTPASRGALITVTSVILYALGALVATAGFALVGIAGVVALGTMFGVVLPSALVARLPFLGSFMGLSESWLLGVGALLVAVGILELGAGQRLWHLRRSGGLLGVSALVLGIVASAFFLPLRPTGEVVGFIGIIVALGLLGLVAVAWRRLR